MRRALSGVAPETAAAVLSARARAHSQRLVQQWGLGDLNQKLIRELGTRVLSGPFAGMTLTPMTYREHVGPYLLGTYEMELHPWWEQVFQQSFAQILDVGAKFGYYAVGLARRFPGVPNVAFDTDWWARKAVREMAAANDAAAISVQTFCSPAWLADRLLDGALIVSDCEGYEQSLFCSTSIDRLGRATMIIETHEFAVSGVRADLTARFAPTHVIFEESSCATPPRPSVVARSLTEEELVRVSHEVRPPQTWMFLVPKR